MTTSQRIFLALALVGWVVFGVLNWRSANPHDFYQFWLIGQTANDARISNIYDEADQRRLIEEGRRRSVRSGSAAEIAGARTWSAIGLEPAGTPFLYATFALVSSGDFDRDFLVFRVASLTAYVGAIAALALLLHYPLWAVFGATVLFTQLYWPFFTDTGFANVSQLQVALIVLLLLLLRRETPARDILAGGLVGLLLLFKPTVVYVAALLAVAWLVEGRAYRTLRAVAGGLLGLAIGFTTPHLLFGDSCTWTGWRAALPRELFSDRYLGGGFLGKLIGLRWLPGYSLFGLLLFLVVALLVVAAARSHRRSAPNGARERHGEPTLIALGLAVYLLSGPIVHSHYFLLAVPLALIALRSPPRVWRRGTAAVAVALMAAHPLLKLLGLTHAPNHSLWSFLGVWILLALVLESFWSEARGAANAAESERVAG